MLTSPLHTHRQLRVDSVAQLLMQANVQAGARMLVADTCQGLVLGAVLQRMGCQGEVVHLYTGDRTAVTAMDAYNFPPEQRAIVRAWPLDMLQQVEGCAQAEGNDGDDEVAELMTRKAAWDASQGDWDTVFEERVVRRAATRKTRRRVAEELLGGRYDGLIIATKYQPLQVANALLPYLGASRPFAIYYPYKEVCGSATPGAPDSRHGLPTLCIVHQTAASGGIFGVKGGRGHSAAEPV